VVELAEADLLVRSLGGRDISWPPSLSGSSVSSGVSREGEMGVRGYADKTPGGIACGLLLTRPGGIMQISRRGWGCGCRVG